ncbi:hypothetical protein PCASD_00392 [Puccinia coronata f. sp. avenae]|uniref:SAC domain-containing protein n=1 Tax=Puccinia coronata f. sp. avenae TaxID=200324 RepID=A0A2N5VND7_9BASI|nr:hypothetical protein PCASD_21329 [Puccinia coronata f. sp. avenae]PLW51512.1 hypothetical protein PCASD_00392 [Puccinia coronata f. sp. avenae]
MSSATSFSLPNQVSLYVASRALFIRPNYHPRLPANDLLVRIEWSQQPTLALIRDQQTIQDELSQPDTLKIQLAGLVGLIQLFQDTYLISISSQSVVARFQEKELHRIEGVLAIPLVYQKAHEIVKNEIIRTRPRIGQTMSSISSSTSNNTSRTTTTTSNDGVSSEIDQQDNIPPEADEDLPQASLPSSSSSPSLSSSVEEGFQKIVESNVINFSRLLWKPKPPDHHDVSIPANTTVETTENHRRSVQLPRSTGPTTLNSRTTEESQSTNLEGRLSLDKKFMAVLCEELTRGGMFYALDWDITHSFQSKADLCSENQLEPRISEPLHTRAQQRFWWNQRLIQPFIRSGFDNLGYVVMQGFVESTQVKISKLQGDQRMDTIILGSSESVSDEAEEENEVQEEADTVDLEIGLISRRSILRPGLRYQRRGIDGAGSVANAVETECVMAVNPSRTGDQQKGQQEEKPVFWSFVQVRGSVPLFWSQNPAGLRPPIVLEGDPTENLDAMKKHFADLCASYGRILVICLAEKSGNEARLVVEFERQLELLKQTFHPHPTATKDEPVPAEEEKDWVKFLGWDFHQKCKGMHYEKVLDLVQQIDSDISNFGYFSRTGDRQKGVIRSNCIDCLDRTNVIQSAIAKQVLNSFLRHLNLPINPDLTHDQLDVKFNSLWANNGDQISKQYAGTSALKGDFVRTGRRNWRGIVNDATNSVARMWHNSISDFFKQRVIDYTLGINVTTFSQFQQSYLSMDPNDSNRFAKFRLLAIEDAAKQVLSEGESKIEGWNFLTPSEETAAHSVNTVPLGLEERIVILSPKALYIVSYEYVLSKVQEFLRIGFEDIVSLQLGVYITSLADERERDEDENYGFVISYDNATEKKNTYSMRQERSTMTPEGGGDESGSFLMDAESPATRTIKQVVFKAPRELAGDSLPTVSHGLGREEGGGKTGPTGRLTAEGFVAHVVKRIERECNHNQIVFLDEHSSVPDEHPLVHTNQPSEETEKLRKLILLLRSPIISIADHPQPFKLFARMSRGVKQIIG